MALEYDKEKFNEFRAMAATSVDDLKVGETYYSNSYPEKFTVLEIISDREHYRRQGLEGIADIISKDKEALAWFVYKNEAQVGECYGSLSDRNIGASYNPWMIFKDLETMEWCKKELKIVMVHEPEEYWDDSCLD